VTINLSIAVTNTVGRSAVVFCACKIIHLFSVVFFVSRAFHKFDIRLFIKETPYKWRPMGKSHAVIGTPVFDRISIFFPDRFREFYVTLFMLGRSTAVSLVRDSN
jgi:hypothetical protein